MLEPEQFNHNLAKLVSSESIETVQRSTCKGLQNQSDFSQQLMIKHPFVSDFHSPEEHLHAGLLEGNSNVISYVPQPFRVRIRGVFYTPDCFVLYKSGQRVVIEIKPRGEFDDEKHVPMKHFLYLHNMSFEVVSNESIRLNEIEAKNWLEITTIMNQGEFVDTQVAEINLYNRFILERECELSDVVDAGDRERTYLDEMALFNLLHRGKLQAELKEHPLDYNTRIFL